MVWGSTTAKRAWSAGVSLAVLALAPPAWSQQQDAAEGAPTEAEGDDSQIIVTGSRVPRSTFETPTPVTVLAVEDLLKSSPSTLAAALNNLPALVASGGPNATAGQRTSGRNALDLRGIGTPSSRNP